MNLPRALRIVVAFVLGLIAGEAVPIVGYIIATTYFGVFDRDGGGAMGAIFIMGPACALVVGTVAAIIVARRSAKARSEAQIADADSAA